MYMMGQVLRDDTTQTLERWSRYGAVTGMDKFSETTSKDIRPAQLDKAEEEAVWRMRYHLRPAMYERLSRCEKLDSKRRW